VREVFSSKVKFHKKSRLLLTTLTTYFTDKTGVIETIDCSASYDCGPRN